MGIPGLLVALKSVTHPVHISEYKGLTVGVDAYGWLHRGTFSCSTELCTNADTDKYVTFCMKRVSLLQQYGAVPFLVFDGASLPLKGNKHLERRRQREANLARGQEALAVGESGAAAHHFAKAARVTQDMAYELIKALRRAGVKFVVAPFEADAQLAHLSRTGVVDAVITEDSDCLPYGCKKVLFKLDNDGNGQEIQLRNLAANKPLPLCNWKNSMFLDLCLLIGCDYITASVKGLGITTAHKLVEKHRKLDKIIHAVESTKLVVPEGYWEQYRRARLTFRHHIVYDTQTQSTIHLMPLGDSAREMGNLDFLGAHLPPVVAQGIASGRLYPRTHEPYEQGVAEDPNAPTPLSPSKVSGNIDACSALAIVSPVEDIGAITPMGAMGRPAVRPTSPKVVESHEKDPRPAHLSKIVGHRPELMPPTHLPESRELIERPFCTDRAALAERPFMADDRRHHLSIPWSVSPPRLDGCGLWAPSDRDPHSTNSKPSAEFPKTRLKLSSCENRRTEPEVVHKIASSVADRAARDAPELCGMFDRVHAGLGLVTARASASPLPNPSRSILSVPRELLSQPERRDLPQCSAAVAIEQRISPFGTRPGRKVSHCNVLDGLEHRLWRAEFARPRDQHREHVWGIGSSLSPEDGWGEHFTGTLHSVSRDQPAHDGSRSHQEAGEGNSGLSSQSSMFLDDSKNDPRVGNVGVSAVDVNDDEGAAKLFGWACYSRSEPKGAEQDHSDVPEAETGQDARRVPLGTLMRADRSKYVPTSARHFQSTQVSQELETLQRRKRRLSLAREKTYDASSTPAWPCVEDAAVTSDRGTEGFDALFLQGIASGDSGGGSWMCQSSLETCSSPDGNFRRFPGHNGAEGSKRLPSLSRSRDSEQTIVPELNSKDSPSLVMPPLEKWDTRAPGTDEGRDIEERNRDTPRAPSRRYTPSSQPWTVPTHVQQSNGLTNLPLLRLLGGENADSFGGSEGRARSSHQLPKRLRGVDYWDARLMR